MFWIFVARSQMTSIIWRDLISKLLTSDLSRRLGNLKDGAKDIRNHPWFKGLYTVSYNPNREIWKLYFYAGFDWEALLNRTMPAPLSINVRGEDDVSMFDEYDDDDGPDVGITRWNKRSSQLTMGFELTCFLSAAWNQRSNSSSQLLGDSGPRTEFIGGRSVSG